MQTIIHITYHKCILVHAPIQTKSVKVHAQSIFYAPIKMLIEAALNKQLTGIPFINNTNIICKYLSPLLATPKGRMKKPKSGIRSTRKKLKSGGATKLGMEIADSDSENET